MVSLWKSLSICENCRVVPPSGGEESRVPSSGSRERSDPPPPALRAPHSHLAVLMLPPRSLMASRAPFLPERCTLRSVALRQSFLPTRGQAVRGDCDGSSEPEQEKAKCPGLATVRQNRSRRRPNALDLRRFIRTGAGEGQMPWTCDGSSEPEIKHRRCEWRCSKE
ncbi:MAG: hypothetical protein PWR21_1546 [Methanoculleus sp.]|nr:hypothetical protein [Methanoculleus sp.]